MTAKKTTTKKAAKAAPVAVPDKGMSKGFYKTYELFQAGVTKFYGYDVDAAHTTGTHRSMKAVKAEIDTYLGSSDEMTPEAMDAEPVVQEIYALVEEASVTVAALDPVDETLAETDQYLEDFANPSEEQDAAAVVEEEEPSMVDDTDRPSMESLHRYRASHTKLSNISLEGSETYVAPKDFASIGAAQEFKSAAGGFNLIEDTVDNVAVMFAPYGPEGFFQWQTVSADAVADAAAVASPNSKASATSLRASLPSLRRPPPARRRPPRRSHRPLTARRASSRCSSRATPRNPVPSAPRVSLSTAPGCPPPRRLKPVCSSATSTATPAKASSPSPPASRALASRARRRARPSRRPR